MTTMRIEFDDLCQQEIRISLAHIPHMELPSLEELNALIEAGDELRTNMRCTGVTKQQAEQALLDALAQVRAL